MLFKKISGITIQIRQRIELYGLRQTLLRILKAILKRCFGFTREKCLLMSRYLDDICLPPARNDIVVRELEMADYDNELWRNFLTKEKQAIYEKWFKDEKIKAFGAFVNGKLAYSTWISYGEVLFSKKHILLKDHECALLLDSYCQPCFRGMGIHNYMNQWCLYQMKSNKIKKSYVIVLSFNRPAIKTQKKCGMEVERVFYAYKFRKKIYIKNYVKQ